MSEEELKLLKKQWKEQENLKPAIYYSEDYVKELQERIDKAIDYIENKKLHQKVSTVPTYSMQERELLDILRGEDKE